VPYNSDVGNREETPGFQIPPKRWIVERIFSLLIHFQNLTKNYVEHSKAFICASAAPLIRHKVAFHHAL